METFKLIELRATYEAVEAALYETEGFDALDKAWAACLEEEARAHALQEKFYAEYNDEECDNGMCNARDTAVEYGAYKKYGATVERTTEFWQCAIDSAQVCRDFK
jgi:hypothetical protein